MQQPGLQFTPVRPSSSEYAHTAWPAARTPTNSCELAPLKLLIRGFGCLAALSASSDNDQPRQIISILRWQPRIASRHPPGYPPGADGDAVLVRHARMVLLRSQPAALRPGRPGRDPVTA